MIAGNQLPIPELLPKQERAKFRGPLGHKLRDGKLCVSSQSSRARCLTPLPNKEPILARKRRELRAVELRWGGREAEILVLKELMFQKADTQTIAREHVLCIR